MKMKSNNMGTNVLFLGVVLIILVGLVVGGMSLFSGNRKLGFGNYSYSHAHIMGGDLNSCVDITGWYENENTGIEVVSDKYGSIWCSEGTYILFESADKCPFCDS